MTHLPVVNSRSCGSCTACCETLQVKSLEKADYKRCKYLRRGSIKGCGIYKSRPADCSAYECLWKAGSIEPGEFRPDKCGFVLSVSEFSIKDTEDEEEKTPFVMVHETKPGASHSPLALAILQSIAEEFLVIEIMRDGLRKIRGGPRDQVDRMIAIAKEHQAKGTPGYLFEDRTS